MTVRDGLEEYRTLAERPQPDYVLGLGWRALRPGAVVVGLIPVLMILQATLGGGSDAGLGWTAVLTWAACVVGPAVLSRHPRIFNYPQMPTSANVQRLYRLGEITMLLVSAGCAVVLWGMTAAVGLPVGWLTWVGIVGLAASVIWAVRRTLQA